MKPERLKLFKTDLNSKDGVENPFTLFETLSEVYEYAEVLLSNFPGTTELEKTLLKACLGYLYDRAPIHEQNLCMCTMLFQAELEDQIFVTSEETNLERLFSMIFDDEDFDEEHIPSYYNMYKDFSANTNIVKKQTVGSLLRKFKKYALSEMPYEYFMNNGGTEDLTKLTDLCFSFFSNIADNKKFLPTDDKLLLGINDVEIIKEDAKTFAASVKEFYSDKKNCISEIITATWLDVDESKTIFYEIKNWNEYDFEANPISRLSKHISETVRDKAQKRRIEYRLNVYDDFVQ